LSLILQNPSLMAEMGPAGQRTRAVNSQVVARAAGAYVTVTASTSRSQRAGKFLSFMRCYVYVVNKLIRQLLTLSLTGSRLVNQTTLYPLHVHRCRTRCTQLSLSAILQIAQAQPNLVGKDLPEDYSRVADRPFPRPTLVRRLSMKLCCETYKVKPKMERVTANTD